MKFTGNIEFPYEEKMFSFACFCFLNFSQVWVVNDRRIRFEALQSEAGKKLLMRSGRAPDYISSVVLVEKDR